MRDRYMNDTKLAITENQLKFKPKKVGTLKGKDVYRALTKGGLNLILFRSETGLKTLGIGSHIALARHIATLNEPDISWTELSKAEELPVETFQHLIPFWSNFTQDFDLRINELNG